MINIDWNFVYPPAYVDPETGERHLEAWCRTPLCLLVRPDEGNFDSNLRGISDNDRQALLQDVLSSGCADPNFPLVYWSTPSVHACFEGDVAALEALRASGCNLRQKFERYDEDDSGQICKEEFSKILAELIRVKNPDDIPQERFNHYWREVDQDQSG